MQNVNFLLWLPLLALVLGGITHSLTDDGAASILDHFGISWRFPKWSLPLGILVFGTASGFVDNLVGGQDLQHAAVTALTSLVASVFGATTQHALVNKTVPKVPLLPLLFAAALAMSTTACSWFQQNAALFPTPQMIACVATEVNNGDTDPRQIIKACPDVAQLALEDLQKLIDGEVVAKAARTASASKSDGGAK